MLESGRLTFICICVGDSISSAAVVLHHMETIDCFVIDDCIESLLTAVFEAYRRKIRPRWLYRRRKECSLFEYGGEVVNPDMCKARKVWRYMTERVDKMLVEMLFAAHAVGSEQTDMAIFRVICRILDGHRYVPGDYSDMDMADVLWSYRKACRRETGRARMCAGVVPQQPPMIEAEALHAAAIM